MNDNNGGSPVRPPHTPERPKWLWIWSPTVVWMLAIFIGTSIPGASSSREGGKDKIQHFLVYGILAVLMYRSWRLSQTSHRPRLGLAAITMLTTGGWALLDELHQIPIPGRTCNILDLAADAAGLVVGLMLITYWQRRRQRQASRP